MASIQERFCAKVERIPFMDCHIWIGATNYFGYGKFSKNGKNWTLAHRFSYEQFNGEIPKNKFVLHTCDNPFCVNPDHLRLGTVSDNMKDRSAKGRWAGPKKNPVNGQWLPKEVR